MTSRGYIVDFNSSSCLFFYTYNTISMRKLSNIFERPFAQESVGIKKRQIQGQGRYKREIGKDYLN